MGSRYLVMLVAGTAALILHDVTDFAEAERLRDEAVERTRSGSSPSDGSVVISVVHSETKL